MFVDKFSSTHLKGSERIATPIVYLCHQWNGTAITKDAPQIADGVRWIAEHATWPEEGGDRATLEQIESMPDASVVESIWLRRNTERNKLEAARGKMGDAVDSLLFYQSARHAIYLADVLGKRGTKLVHAHRSDAVVTTWLLKQLMPTLKITAAIEENPALPRGLLARLLPDFDRLSISDSRLNEQLKTTQPDMLKLVLPFVHQELRFGPIKVKKRKAAPAVDRKAVEFAWLKQLKEVIS
jgi:hypothetical protein